jgi:hypothetical protein
MKHILSITVLFLLSSSVFGQKKVKKKTQLQSCAGATVTKQFQVGDTLLTCNTCHWDECGNVINSNSDTLYKNKSIVHPDFHPIFLTSDSILLTKKIVHTLVDKNKIRHMQFLHCNEVASKMGFIALEGLYFVDLRDTTISTFTLLNAVRTKYSDNNILTSQILINGYHIQSDKIKYPKYHDIEIKFLEKSNLYCVLTE